MAQIWKIGIVRQVNRKNIQAGFTLIELLIVLVILGLIVSFGGWNYIQYARQASVEGAARELRSFLTEAKNNARYGKFTDARWGQDHNSLNFCYVGDLTWTKAQLDGSTLDESSLYGYDTYLEMVGSGGIVLENWAVYFDTRDANQTTLWMQVYCKHKNKNATKYTFPTTEDAPNYGPLNDGLRTKTLSFQPGVVIQKPKPDTNDTAQGGGKRWGVEFVPLYLNVRYPVPTGARKVDFGYSCYGEANDEIVIGDVDGKYLYKIKVGIGGDVSKGCFCQGNAEGLNGGCVSNIGQGSPCYACKNGNMIE